MGFIGKLFRFFTLRAAEGFVVILLIALMPNLPPYCKISDPKTITPELPFEGKLALNNKLDDVELWHHGELVGPEAFADYNGELYVSLHNGVIAKLTGHHITPVVTFGKPCKGFYQEKICGRPLGMAFDKDGYLTAADAYYGIFRVNVKTGEKTQLVSPDTEINGKKPKLTNSIAIATNGDIYWSDSSTEFILEDGMIDMFADGSGRLVHYNSKTKENTVLIDNLSFANGVALSEDEEFVIVAETGSSRIHRYYLKGPKKGTTDIFVDGLPGLPDNLKRDGKGGFFVPLVVSRDSSHPLPQQMLAPFPIARKFVARVFGLTQFGLSLIEQVYPNELTEKAMHFVGHFSSASFILPKRVTILRVSKSGEILDSFHTLNTKISTICEVHIYKDQVLLGSPFNDYIGRISLKKLGLEDLVKKEQVPKRDELPTTTSKPPSTTTPKPTTTTPKPTTTTPKPTTTTPKPTTTTPKPTTTTPKPTTTPAPTTTTSKPTTATPKPTAATPKSTGAPPKPTATTQKPAEKPKTTQIPVTEQPKAVPPASNSDESKTTKPPPTKPMSSNKESNRKDSKN